MLRDSTQYGPNETTSAFQKKHMMRRITSCQHKPKRDLRTLYTHSGLFSKDINILLKGGTQPEYTAGLREASSSLAKANPTLLRRQISAGITFMRQNTLRANRIINYRSV